MANDQTVIRRAGTADVEALCGLYLEFHEFHVRGVPERLASLGSPEAFDATDLRAALGRVMAGPDSALFVAEVEGRVTGLAEVYVEQDEPHSAAVAYRYGKLQSLMVTAEFRRQGIARQLVAAAEAWARGRGAGEMRLQTWEFAAGPLPFYESLGYRTIKRTLVRKIEGQ